VVHLACHGRADLLSPLDDSLLLAGDQPLTLRDIIRVRLDREATVRLAVLSACETSIAGLEAPDEVVSLPSGLLEAGVAGVVAAQWRVPDLSAAILMTRFYAEWASTGTDPAAALQAAQRWIRDSTNKDIAEYFASRELPPQTSRPLWRSLIRMDSQQRGFAHPAHWAGFIFSGA
jgi:CHAT domain-containing protein